MMCMNNQELTNLHGNVIFHIQHQSVLFLGPSKAQGFVLTGRNVSRFCI